MSNRNIFRVERQSIKDIFIQDYTPKENNISKEKEPDCYVKTSLHMNWLASKSKVKRIDTSDYEETLIKFLQQENEEEVRHPLLIIVGGAGSGKSSSINYALKHSKRPSSDVLLIDYLPIKSAIMETTQIHDEEDMKEREDRFWYHIIETCAKIADGHIDIEHEVTNFWKWLTSNYKGKFSFRFFKFLFPKMHLTANSRQNNIELRALRDQLYTQFAAEEIAYYNLAKLAFLKQNKTIKCNIIIFDSIDTLEPPLQAQLIDFSIEAYRLLNCKSIIPMRPYTFHLSIEGNDFIEVIDHCMPSIKDVIDRRLKYYQQKCEGDVVIYLTKMMESIFEKDRVIRDVFDAAAGESIRFGLRNLYNLLLSPLIVTHVDDKGVTDIDMNTNIFFQAFFCSEGKSEELYERHFVNIIAFKKAARLKYLTLIKLRLLYFIYQLGESSLRELVAHLEWFNYIHSDILSVINEFLERNKALIWSSSASHYDETTILSEANHTIAITPMGINYFEKLITEPQYIRECIVSLEGQREVYRDRSLQKTMSILKELFSYDVEEIKEYVFNNSIDDYKKYYRDTDICITLVLWNKLISNLNRIANNLAKFDLEKNYADYMQSEVNKILFDMEKSDIEKA